MKKWIFTFGSGQKFEGRYVEILASDFFEARDKMINKYGEQWSFQYTEDEWNNWIEKAIALGLQYETILETIQ